MGKRGPRRKPKATKPTRRKREKVATVLSRRWQHVQIALPDRTLPEAARIVIKQNGVARKLARLAFNKNTLDFYLILPYLKVDRTYYLTMRERGGRTRTFDLEDKTVAATSQRRMKLSYHESGEIHAREQLNGPTPSLTAIQGVPLRGLSGQEVFVAEFDGVDSFDVAGERDLKQWSTIGIELDPPVRRIRLIGYAGFAEDEITGKYRTLNGVPIAPTVTIRFARERLASPLLLGLYIMSASTLRTDRDDTAFEFAQMYGAPEGDVVPTMHMQAYHNKR